MKTKEVQYIYDAFNRRISKSVDDDGNGTFDRGEHFVYDGSDIVFVFDDAGAMTVRLLYGPAVDQPLASEDGAGEVRWFLADHQGTVRDVAAYDDVSGDTSEPHPVRQLREHHEPVGLVRRAAAHVHRA